MRVIRPFRSRTLSRLRRDDEGAALVLVVALVAVSALAGVAVASSIMSANSVTTITRADVQAKAAAQAGIDVAYGRMTAGSLVCSAPPVAGGPTYTATVQYFTGAGASVPCTGATVTGVPAKAVITSIGTAANPGTTSAIGDRHTMRAEVDIVAAVSEATLDKAVYSDASFVVTNDSALTSSTTGAIDADIYTNGGVDCTTQIQIQGNVRAQQSVKLSNNCKVAGEVWSGGTVTAADGVEVAGNVFAAGGAATNLGKAHVRGTVVTNGDVLMSNGASVTTCPSGAWSVCGSVISLGGGVTANQDSNIGGSVYAKNSVVLKNHNGRRAVGHNVVSTAGSLVGDGVDSGQSGSIGGSARVAGKIDIRTAFVGNTAESCSSAPGDAFAACPAPVDFPTPVPAVTLPPTLGYPGGTVVNPPPRQSFPKISSDLSKWVSSGWNPVTINGCSAATNYIKGFSWTTKTVLTVTGCSSQIDFQNATIKLPADLAVLAPGGFKSSNDLRFESMPTTEQRTLMWIVPSDSTFVHFTPVPGDPENYTVSCDPGLGNINFDKVHVTNVTTLLYSPCTVSFANQSQLRGQVYGGSVSYSNNIDMDYRSVPVPGVTSTSTGSSTPASVTITARYDVAG